MDLLDFCCFFVIIYRSRLSRLYVSFPALKEQQLEEEDYNYMEELGDDQFAVVKGPNG